MTKKMTDGPNGNEIFSGYFMALVLFKIVILTTILASPIMGIETANKTLHF
jgi:hypothetical protein